MHNCRNDLKEVPYFTYIINIHVFYTVEVILRRVTSVTTAILDVLYSEDYFCILEFSNFCNIKQFEFLNKLIIVILFTKSILNIQDNLK